MTPEEAADKRQLDKLGQIVHCMTDELFNKSFASALKYSKCSNLVELLEAAERADAAEAHRLANTFLATFIAELDATPKENIDKQMRQQVESLQAYVQTHPEDFFDETLRQQIGALVAEKITVEAARQAETDAEDSMRIRLGAAFDVAVLAPDLKEEQRRQAEQSAHIQEREEFRALKTQIAAIMRANTEEEEGGGEQEQLKRNFETLLDRLSNWADIGDDTAEFVYSIYDRFLPHIFPSDSSVLDCNVRLIRLDVHEALIALARRKPFARLIKSFFARFRRAKSVEDELYQEPVHYQIEELERRLAILVQRLTTDHQRLGGGGPHLAALTAQFCALAMDAPRHVLTRLVKEALAQKHIAPLVNRIFRRLRVIADLPITAGGRSGEGGGGGAANKKQRGLLVDVLRQQALEVAHKLPKEEILESFTYLLAILSKRKARTQQQAEGELYRNLEEDEEEAVIGQGAILHEVLGTLLFTPPNEHSEALSLAAMLQMLTTRSDKTTRLKWVDIEEGAKEETAADPSTVVAAHLAALLIERVEFWRVKRPDLSAMAIRVLRAAGKDMTEKGFRFSARTAAMLLDTLCCSLFWTEKFLVVDAMRQPLGGVKQQIPSGLFKALVEEDKKDDEELFEEIATDVRHSSVECFLRSIFELALVDVGTAKELIELRRFVHPPAKEQLVERVAMALIDSLPVDATLETLCELKPLLETLLDKLDPVGYARFAGLTDFSSSTFKALCALRAPLQMAACTQMVFFRVQRLEQNKDAGAEQSKAMILRMTEVFCQWSKQRADRRLENVRLVQKARSAKKKYASLSPNLAAVLADAEPTLEADTHAELTALFNAACTLAKLHEPKEDEGMNESKGGKSTRKKIPAQLTFVLKSLAEQLAEILQIQLAQRDVLLDAIRPSTVNEDTVYAVARPPPPPPQQQQQQSRQPPSWEAEESPQIHELQQQPGTSQIVERPAPFRYRSPPSPRRYGGDDTAGGADTPDNWGDADEPVHEDDLLNEYERNRDAANHERGGYRPRQNEQRHFEEHGRYGNGDGDGRWRTDFGRAPRQDGADEEYYRDDERELFTRRGLTQEQFDSTPQQQQQQHSNPASNRNSYWGSYLEEKRERRNAETDSRRANGREWRAGAGNNSGGGYNSSGGGGGGGGGSSDRRNYHHHESSSSNNSDGQEFSSGPGTSYRRIGASQPEVSRSYRPQGGRDQPRNDAATTTGRGIPLRMKSRGSTVFPTDQDRRQLSPQRARPNGNNRRH